MAKYRVRTNQYCALSKEQKWQSWLQSVAPDLHEELMNQIAATNSCKANHFKMMEIQKALSDRGLLQQMVLFLKKEFPFTIDKLGKETPKPKAPDAKLVQSITNDEVFRVYHPNLLTFPQKAIIEHDNPETLARQVRDFCQGKVGTDYIIVGSRAYVEYFKLKYTKESKEIDPKSRDIFRYRARKGLGATVKRVEEGTG